MQKDCVRSSRLTVFAFGRSGLGVLTPVTEASPRSPYVPATFGVLSQFAVRTMGIMHFSDEQSLTDHRGEDRTLYNVDMCGLEASGSAFRP